jgi:hypothetical protein
MRDVSVDLRGALRPNQHKHFAALTDPDKVGEMLRTLEGFAGTSIVGAALRLAPLLFVRPGELRQAEWSQFDLERREWRYIVSKTKTEHFVPLATQAVGILRELHVLTGKYRFVFPGRDRRKPMSAAAINAALQRLGFDTKTEITGHGFRAMARTILHERLRFPAEVIEHQLAHRVPDILGTAYNRTRFLDDRIEMMQAWADYLELLKTGHGTTNKEIGDMKAATIHSAEGPHRERLLDAFVSGADLGSDGSDNSAPPVSYLAVAKLLRYFAHAFAVAHYADRLNHKSKAH